MPGRHVYTRCLVIICVVMLCLKQCLSRVTRGRCHVSYTPFIKYTTDMIAWLPIIRRFDLVTRGLDLLLVKEFVSTIG